MPIETWIKIWKTGFAIAILSVIQFMFFSIVAISMYPGGTIKDPNTIGYVATSNYISDLGRSVSISGQDNRVAARMFNWSVTALGFGTLPFFFFLPTQANDRLVALSTAGFFGVCGSFALIVIGQSPVDMYPVLHLLMLMIWLAATFFATSIHAIALLTSDDNPTLLALLSVAVAMLAVSYMYHATETAAAVMFGREIPLKSVFLQKLVVISALIWLLSFSVKMLLTTDFSDFYERRTSQETEDYLSELKSNPRR